MIVYTFFLQFGTTLLDAWQLQLDKGAAYLEKATRITGTIWIKDFLEEPGDLW
jgi:hypothetical protein